MAQRDETVAECSLTSHVWAVSGQVPTLSLDSSIVSPLRLHWVKGACVFRCNLPPPLLVEWSGSFTCHCGNMGVEQTPNMSQHTKITLKKKNSPTAPARIWTHNLSITSPALLPTSYPGSIFTVALKRCHTVLPKWVPNENWTDTKTPAQPLQPSPGEPGNHKSLG